MSRVGECAIRRAAMNEYSVDVIVVMGGFRFADFRTPSSTPSFDLARRREAVGLNAKRQ